MRTLAFIAWLAAACWVLGAASVARGGQPFPNELPDGGWIALTFGADGEPVPAPAPMLEQPDMYRQILVLPTGYTKGDARKYLADALQLIKGVSTAGHGIFTDRFRNRLVYIVQFAAGEALGPVSAREPSAGTPRPALGGRVYPHPVRAGQLGFTLDNAAVMDRVDTMAAGVLPALRPIAVFVLFNFDNPGNQEMIPNAVLPAMLIAEQADRRVHGYGIVRMNRLGARRSRDAIVAAHELAHAALNLCDEYSEGAARGRSVTDLDPLTPLLLADGSPGAWMRALDVATGDLDIRFSECLAENAWDNVSLRREAPGRANFNVEGGMFFPRGTWHEDDTSLMAGSGRGLNARDAHPSSHDLALGIAFEGHSPQRPNARIRAAGPRSPLPVLGSHVTVMLMDGDKHHRWQPTKRYEVECRYDAWTLATPARRPGLLSRSRALTRTERVDTYTIEPTLMAVDLRRSAFTRVAGEALRLLRSLGVKKLDLRASGGAVVNLDFTIQDILDSALPSGAWPLPYQPVTLRLPEPFTRYQWRFRTFNGALWSDWTPWQTLTRGL